MDSIARKIIICSNCDIKKEQQACGLCSTCYMRKYMKLYYHQHPDKKKAQDKKYRVRHKEVIAKYYKEHKEEQKIRNENFKKTHPGYYTDYFKSDKGKESHIKSNTKRKRKLEWIKLCDNPFDDSEIVEWHHIDDNYIVAIPKDLHRQYLGKNHRENTMKILNQIYLF